LFHKLRDLIDKHGSQLNLRGLVKQLEPELPFPFQLRAGLLRSLVEGWVQAGWTTLKPVNRETVRLGGLDAVELPLGRRQQLTTAILEVALAALENRRGKQRVDLDFNGLLQAIEQRQGATDIAELKRSLSFLHDRDIARLDEGLTLIRQA